jgi:hypothetical protein
MDATKKGNCILPLLHNFLIYWFCQIEANIFISTEGYGRKRVLYIIGMGIDYM